MYSEIFFFQSSPHAHKHTWCFSFGMPMPDEQQPPPSNMPRWPGDVEGYDPHSEFMWQLPPEYDSGGDDNSSELLPLSQSPTVRSVDMRSNLGSPSPKPDRTTPERCLSGPVLSVEPNAKVSSIPSPESQSQEPARRADVVDLTHSPSPVGPRPTHASNKPPAPCRSALETSSPCPRPVPQCARDDDEGLQPMGVGPWSVEFQQELLVQASASF